MGHSLKAISYSTIEPFCKCILTNDLIGFKEKFDKLPDYIGKVEEETSTLRLDSTLCDDYEKKVCIFVNSSPYREGYIDFIYTNYDFDLVVRSTNDPTIIDWYHQVVGKSHDEILKSCHRHFMREMIPYRLNDHIYGEYFYVSYNCADSILYNNNCTTSLSTKWNTFFIVLNGNHVDKVRGIINDFNRVRGYFLTRSDDEYALFKSKGKLYNASSKGFDTKLCRLV